MSQPGESLSGERHAIIVRSQGIHTEGDWWLPHPGLSGGDGHSYVEWIADSPGAVGSDLRRACGAQLPNRYTADLGGD